MSNVPKLLSVQSEALADGLNSAGQCTANPLQHLATGAKAGNAGGQTEESAKEALGVAGLFSKKQLVCSKELAHDRPSFVLWLRSLLGEGSGRPARIVAGVHFLRLLEHSRSI